MVTQTRGTEVVFRFFRPQANRVFLVGDFNGWNRTATPMSRGEGGEWTCRLELPEGTYQFKYLADGEWFLDYAAFGIERGAFGWNSVLVIDAPASHARYRAPTAAVVAAQKVREARAIQSARTQTATH